MPATSDAMTSRRAKAAFAGSARRRPTDLDVLAEFEAVRLAAIGARTDPVTQDRTIRAEIDRLREEAARLARLRGLQFTAAYAMPASAPCARIDADYEHRRWLDRVEVRFRIVGAVVAARVPTASTA